MCTCVTVRSWKVKLIQRSALTVALKRMLEGSSRRLGDNMTRSKDCPGVLEWLQLFCCLPTIMPIRSFLEQIKTFSREDRYVFFCVNRCFPDVSADLSVI